MLFLLETYRLFQINLFVWQVERFIFNFQTILSILDDCSALIKQPKHLNIENDLWQVLETPNATFKMFNAYLDNRNGSIVRVLSFINKPELKAELFCQLWFKDIDRPLIVQTSEYRVIWHKEWGWNTKGAQPHLIACENPRLNSIPTSVSLVERKCDQATNVFEVINNLPDSPTKKQFAVCAKDLDFMDDQTPQIVEWIEILSILGADKIFVYVVKIHPNMMKTLKFYETKGKVQIEMMTEPKGLPNRTESLTQWLQNELISLNDCLYKHMNEYEFLLPLDIDEVIMPAKKEHKTWADLIQHLEKGQPKPHASYEAHNVFFLLDNIHEGEIQSEVPDHMFFLQKIHRAQNFSGVGVGSKAFQSTEVVVAMHNHFPMSCFEYCDFKYIPHELAQLNHYRRDCENYPKDECMGFKKNTVRDVKLWKIKDEVIERVERALEELKSFN
jgi:hypothetical protein